MQAYLILANGRVFRGVSVGCPGTTIGEVVFATGMVGFEETLTDPSYYGQIITQTYPLIGNYGMNSEDTESGKIWAKGYIVREACTTPSNWRCEETPNSSQRMRWNRAFGSSSRCPFIPPVSITTVFSNFGAYRSARSQSA